MGTIGGPERPDLSTRSSSLAVAAIVVLLAAAPGAAAVELIHPTGGKALSGTVTIQWDDFSDEDSYWLRLYDAGVKLEPDLCADCPGFTYELDTSAFADGDEYVLEVDDDNDENETKEEDTTDGSFVIDNTDPETVHALDGPDGEGAWFTGDVTVTLDATDATSGVAETTYAVDGNERTYDGSFEVRGDGVHTVTYASVDEAGNDEPSTNVTIPVDGTDPASELAVGTPMADGGRVTYVTSDTPLGLGAQDATSDVDRIEQRLDGGFEAYDGPFTLSGEPGEYDLEWRAVDIAGNVEETQEVLLELDDVSPALDLDRPQDGGLYVDDQLVAETDPATVEAGPLAVHQEGTSAETVPGAAATGDLTVHAPSDDDGAGVAAVRFYVDGELLATDTTPPYRWTWETDEETRGDHELRVEAEDRVGNVALESQTVEVLPFQPSGLAPAVADAVGSPSPEPSPTPEPWLRPVSQDGPAPVDGPLGSPLP